jgi:hypothetical protein
MTALLQLQLRDIWLTEHINLRILADIFAQAPGEGAVGAEGEAVSRCLTTLQ